MGNENHQASPQGWKRLLDDTVIVLFAAVSLFLAYRLRTSSIAYEPTFIAKAETALGELVAGYRDTAPKLADWLEQNAPEGLVVFALPEHHRKRMRTSNPMERSVQQELKRRTAKVSFFPGEDALLRLVSAVLVEIDEQWASDTKAYIKWECQNA